MLITENKIKQIILEEIQTLINEQQIDEVSWEDIKTKSKETLSKIKGPLKKAATGAGVAAALMGVHNVGMNLGDTGMPRMQLTATSPEETQEVTTDTSDVKRPKPKFKKTKVAKKAIKPSIDYQFGQDNDMRRIVNDSNEIADFNKKRIGSLLNLNSSMVNGVIGRAYNEASRLGGVGRDGDVFMGAIRSRLGNKLKKNEELRKILSYAVSKNLIDKADLGLDIPVK